MYYAKHDFECSVLGKFKKNDQIKEGDRTKVLERLGYIEKSEPVKEYKTKVIKQKPAKPKKKSTKKKARRFDH